MGRLHHFLAVTIVLLGFQNCGKPSHFQREASTNSSHSVDLPPGVSLTADPVLQTQALTILQNKCASCHQTGASGGVTQILNVNHLVASGLIVAGDPAQGALMDSITSGRMPLTGSVSSTEIQILADWISSMVLTGSLPTTPTISPLPAGKTVTADGPLHASAMKVLNTYCAGCHQGANSGGINNVLDIKTLVRTGLVTAGNANVGRLVGAILDGSMPKGNGARVPAGDLEILRQWITSMQIVDDVGQAPLPTRPALDATFTGLFANLIEPKCVACHGPIRNLGGKRYHTHALVSSDSSDIVEKCASGEMPRTPYPAATADELAALRAWVAAGRPNN